MPTHLENEGMSVEERKKAPTAMVALTPIANDSSRKSMSIFNSLGNVRFITTSMFSLPSPASNTL